MIDQLLVIIGATVLVMVTPGPDMVIVTRNTIVAGRAAGMATSAGVLTGNLVHIAYCVVGIGLLISQSIVAFSVLRYLGAAYLVYLGLTSFRAGGRVLPSGADLDAQPAGNWFVQGFVNNVLNPKGTLFYLGVFTMVITPDTTTVVALILIAVMMSISASFWLLFVFTLEHPAVRRVISHSQAGVSRVFGTLLIALGVRVALLGK